LDDSSTVRSSKFQATSPPLVLILVDWKHLEREFKATDNMKIKPEIARATRNVRFKDVKMEMGGYVIASHPNTIDLPKSLSLKKISRELIVSWFPVLSCISRTDSN